MHIFNRTRRSTSPSTSTTATSPNPNPPLTHSQLKLATRRRKTTTLLSALLLSLTVLFLILLEIGSTHNRPAIRNWYFLRIDVSNIIPASVPNAALINTIAQTLGLHDFYQVGLWGFCEGYKGEGVTFCSRPELGWWFNPVEILRNELLAGASINLPSRINNILDLIKFASRVMAGLFLTSAVLSTILVFLAPLSVLSRWWTLPIAILAFLNALFVTAASTIATVMFVIFRNVISSVRELNIGANVGTTMFAFMWVASACAILAGVLQVGLLCCCASRRDVRTGRKRGNEKAYRGVEGAEGGERKSWWRFGRQRS